MCLPLAVAAGAVTAAGAIQGGLAANAQGNYASAVAKQNAATEISAAHDSVTQAQLENTQFYRQVGQVKGQQIASEAANGIDVGYGSALRSQEDTEQGAREDATKMYYNEEQRTKGLYVNAENYVTQARAAKFQGRQALISSVFQAGSSLMGGMSQQAKIRAMQGGGSGATGM